MKAAALCLAAVSLAAACAGTPAPDDPFPDLPRAEVVAETAGGEHRFQVWIAADDSSRARGLMFVREMPADHGMLFLFERAQYASFWMRNTWLALDIAFIGADGRVVNIAQGTTPFSEAPIPSAAPVIAALELLAGTAARVGLRAGDTIDLPETPATAR